MKVSELRRHLRAYVEQDFKHNDVEVMLKWNDGNAFSLTGASNHDAMGIGMSMERFLVLEPDLSSATIRLELNKKVN
jgi:hypothetical protein